MTIIFSQKCIRPHCNFTIYIFFGCERVFSSIQRKWDRDETVNAVCSTNGAKWANQNTVKK